MKQNLREIHFRVSENELSRIDKLKEEFGFKSRAKLCRILLSGSADDLEEHIHFADAKTTKEIRDTIVTLAEDIRQVKWNLSKMGSNINQIAKATNVAKKSGAVAGTATYEIQLKQSTIERGEKYAEIQKKRAEEHIKSYADAYKNGKTQLTEIYANYIKTHCENTDEILAIVRQDSDAVAQDTAVQNPVSVTIDFDADEVRNLVEELEEASEKLGEILWNIK